MGDLLSVGYGSGAGVGTFPEQWSRLALVNTLNEDLQPLVSQNFSDISAIRAGHVVGLCVRLSAAHTTGTITVTILINGVLGTLQAVLNPGPLEQTITQLGGIDSFGPNDVIGLRLLTSAGYTAAAPVNLEAWIDTTEAITATAGASISGVDVTQSARPIPQFQGLQVAPAGLVWVGNASGNSSPLYAINVANTQVVQTASAGGAPVDLAITPDGVKIFAASAFDLTLRVVNAATSVLLATVTGYQPGGVAILPSGTEAYITDQATDTVVRINTTTYLPVGPPIAMSLTSPISIIITPNGLLAFVSCNLGISVIDTVTNLEVATIPTAVAYAKTVVTPDNAFLYAGDNTNFSVNKFNAVTFAPIAAPGIDTPGSFPAFIYGMAITPNGAEVYVTTNQTEVRVIATATDTISATILAVGANVNSLAVDPTGAFVYMTDWSLAPPALSAVVRIATGPKTFITFSPTEVPIGGPYVTLDLPGFLLTDQGGGKITIQPAVVFDPPTSRTNIRSARTQQSLTDNTQVGITNFGSFDGTQDPLAFGATNMGATIGGGNDNSSRGTYSTVAGGNGNTAFTTYGTVSGGLNNLAQNNYAVVGGGRNNIAGATSAVVCGGTDNNIDAGDQGAIVGGRANTLINSAHYSFIGGGQENVADGSSAGVIAGGNFNRLQGGPFQPAIGGGEYNRTQGCWSVVPGGLAVDAKRHGQMSYGLGNFTGDFPPTRGEAQTSIMVLRGATPGVAINETYELDFGADGVGIGWVGFELQDGKAYAFKVTATIGGIQGITRVSRSIELKFNARRDAGLSVITASGTGEAYGDAATTTWTIAATVGAAPDRIAMTFNTGAGTISACHIVAKVEFTEAVY